MHLYWLPCMPHAPHLYWLLCMPHAPHLLPFDLFSLTILLQLEVTKKKLWSLVEIWYLLAACVCLGWMVWWQKSTVKIRVSWEVTLCHLARGSWHLNGTAIFKTLVPDHPLTQHHITAGSKLHQHHSEYLISQNESCAPITRSSHRHVIKYEYICLSGFTNYCEIWSW